MMIRGPQIANLAKMILFLLLNRLGCNGLEAWGLGRGPGVNGDRFLLKICSTTPGKKSELDRKGKIDP
uniref:Putative secreted peptide n=1 Tax=Anopheles braziliensis TaxID=58242 RepID=A0A2M3ZX26_9DIPT